MDAPSASTLSFFQGLKLKPKVDISESERIPGYLNRSQVPPILSRRSMMSKERCGQCLERCAARPIPEIPAPTIRISTCFSMLFFLPKRCYLFLLNHKTDNTQCQVY